MKEPQLISEISSLINKMVFYKLPHENKIGRGEILGLSIDIRAQHQTKDNGKLMATIYRTNNRANGWIIPVEDVYLTLEDLANNMKLQWIDKMVEDYKKGL